jgi:hypothetical protein
MNMSLVQTASYLQGKRAIYGDDSKLSRGYSNCSNGVSGFSNGETKKYQ